MAENRAVATGSNTNMPNGVNAKTLNDINTISKKYESEIRRMFGTVKGFEEVIKKAVDSSIKMNEDTEKAKKKFNEELNAIAEEFGETSKEFNAHLKTTLKQSKEIDASK